MCPLSIVHFFVRKGGDFVKDFQSVLSFHDVVQIQDYLTLHLNDLQVIIGTGDYDLATINDFCCTYRLLDKLAKFRRVYYEDPVREA